ncbi:MAG: hypothetical protein ACRD4P_11785, partial [Bryobacteraceae bacterium]
LRSTLDYLAFQLVKSAGNAPTTKTCFPIYKDAAEYMAKRTRVVKGMTNQAIQAIDAIKPYQSAGWNIQLWRLHQLDIRDKHRALIAIGTAVQGQSVLPSHREHFRQNWIERNPNAPIPDFSKPFGRPAFRGNVLKSGDVLLTIPKSEVNEDMYFRFGLAFNEPSVIEGEPIIETLSQFVEMVRQIVAGFAPML